MGNWMPSLNSYLTQCFHFSLITGHIMKKTTARSEKEMGPNPSRAALFVNKLSPIVDIVVYYGRNLFRDLKYSLFMRAFL